MPYRRPFEGCPGRHRKAEPTPSGAGSEPVHTVCPEGRQHNPAQARSQPGDAGPVDWLLGSSSTARTTRGAGAAMSIAAGLWAEADPPPRPGNSLELLIDGATALPRIAEVLMAARSQVSIAGLEITPDLALTRSGPRLQAPKALARPSRRRGVRRLKSVHAVPATATDIPSSGASSSGDVHGARHQQGQGRERKYARRPSRASPTSSRASHLSVRTRSSL